MKMQKVVIVDYGIGNVKSMFNAINKIGLNPVLSFNRKQILAADALILPGVGAFRKGMENLHNAGLFETIHEFVKTGKPFLGVCLGMQMLLEESEEFGYTPGLGLIKGKVVKLPISAETEDKLPHVSWNELRQPSSGRWSNTILRGINSGTDVYFVHSFVAVPTSPSDVLSITSYGGVDFCSAIHHENIFGTQFHPEKSSIDGLSILTNFVNL